MLKPQLKDWEPTDENNAIAEKLMAAISRELPLLVQRVMDEVNAGRTAPLVRREDVYADLVYQAKEQYGICMVDHGGD